MLEDYRCDGCGRKGVAEPPKRGNMALEEEEDEDEDEEAEEAPLLIRKQLWLCEVHNYPAPRTHPLAPSCILSGCGCVRCRTMRIPCMHHAYTMHTPCLCQVPHVYNPNPVPNPIPNPSPNPNQVLLRPP